MSKESEKNIYEYLKEFIGDQESTYEEIDFFICNNYIQKISNFLDESNIPEAVALISLMHVLAVICYTGKVSKPKFLGKMNNIFEYYEKKFEDMGEEIAEL